MPERITEVGNLQIGFDAETPFWVSAKIRVTLLDHDPTVVTVSVHTRTRIHPATSSDMLPEWLLALLDLCFRIPPGSGDPPAPA